MRLYKPLRREVEQVLETEENMGLDRNKFLVIARLVNYKQKVKNLGISPTKQASKE